jgi:hypothetical protein
VFVHITALSECGTLAEGDVVAYQVEPARNGKMKACNIRIVREARWRFRSTASLRRLRALV